jgi:hypothetical protein
MRRVILKMISPIIQVYLNGEARMTALKNNNGVNDLSK